MSLNPFMLAWSALMALFGFWSLYWGVREWQQGEAKIAFWPQFSRQEQPFGFWLVILGRALGFTFSCILFLTALYVLLR